MSIDPDIDGITSGTIMIRYLKNFTDNITYTYPNKREHGIENQFVPEDTELLIIVDSSTNNTNACESLKDDCVDIIIIDHHPQSEGKENPYALIVNNQLDNYPNKELSGAGMVYKVVQVLDDMLSEEYHEEFIDLCGCGILGDVVSMQMCENRFYVSKALSKDNIKNPGIRAILEKNKVNLDEMNSQTIGFVIAPIINACVRMGNIKLAIDLLLEDEYSECLKLAKEAIKLNNERKKKVEQIFEIADKNVNKNDSVIIVTMDKFEDERDRGFNGLVATKLVEKYNKPAIVVTDNNDSKNLSGSARSLTGFWLKSVLQKSGLCELLEGHTNAFGIEFKKENLKSIIQYLNKKMKPTKGGETVYYDLELDIDEINLDLVEKITKFNKLCGRDAWETKVMIKDVIINERKIMGKTNNTVKLSSDNIDMIKFKTNEDYAKDINTGSKIDVIGTININKFFNWGKRRWIITPQLFLEDYKIAEEFYDSTI